MKSSRRSKLSLVLVGALTVGIGVASAQQAQPEPAPTSPIAAPQFEDSADAALTPAQMLEKAQVQLARLEAGAEAIQKQLREARQSRDVVKSLCLDDKLTQMNVAKRTAAERVSGLEIAVKAGDAERSRHEHAVIGALGERGEALSAEANQCLGEETGYMGDSRLTVEVDPNIAETDPGIPLDPIDSVRPVVFEPPPEVLSPIE